jgi:hypothetical protein
VSEWRLSRFITRTLPSSSLRTPPVSPRGGRSRSALSKSSFIDLPVSSNTSATKTTAPNDASEPSPSLSHQSMRPAPSGFRLSFAENEVEADSNNLYSPAPSIVGGGSRPIRQGRRRSLDQEEEEAEVDEARTIKAVACRTERTRIWVGAAYGATSGTLSGLCLLFTKTGIELLIMSIVGKSNQVSLLRTLASLSALKLRNLTSSITVSRPCHSLDTSNPG